MCYFSLLGNTRKVMKDFSPGAVSHLELLHHIKSEDYFSWFPITSSGQHQILHDGAEQSFSFFQQPDVEQSPLMSNKH